MNAAVCTLLNIGTGGLQHEGRKYQGRDQHGESNCNNGEQHLSHAKQHRLGCFVRPPAWPGRNAHTQKPPGLTDGYRRCVSLRGGVLRLAVSAAAVPALPWDTPASRRHRCVASVSGPTIPDSPNTVTSGEAVQASFAVLSMTSRDCAT
jgi:hypothetical protein